MNIWRILRKIRKALGKKEKDMLLGHFFPRKDKIIVIGSSPKKSLEIRALSFAESEFPPTSSAIIINRIGLEKIGMDTFCKAISHEHTHQVLLELEGKEVSDSLDNLEYLKDGKSVWLV